MASKTSGNNVRVESWTLNKGRTDQTFIRKVAVRDRDGRFHGATNFRGSVLGKR
jgi:DUF438 domain-containing protein